MYVSLQSVVRYQCVEVARVVGAAVSPTITCARSNSSVARRVVDSVRRVELEVHVAGNSLVQFAAGDRYLIGLILQGDRIF